MLNKNTKRIITLLHNKLQSKSTQHMKRSTHYKHLNICALTGKNRLKCEAINFNMFKELSIRNIFLSNQGFHRDEYGS